MVRRREVASEGGVFEKQTTARGYLFRRGPGARIERDDRTRCARANGAEPNSLGIGNAFDASVASALCGEESPEGGSFSMRGRRAACAAKNRPLAMSSSRLAVFAGPSLPVTDRPDVDGVAYLPPASRGDVERAAAEYDALLLVDGVFHHDLAPSPKECYRAAQACRAFGASSMGALRAAECAPYGFLPLGTVARWYRSVKSSDY